MANSFTGTGISFNSWIFMKASLIELRAVSAASTVPKTEDTNFDAIVSSFNQEEASSEINRSGRLCLLYSSSVVQNEEY